MPHLRDMSQNFTGHFESQQKDIFCQSNLHQDKDFKWKNDQHESCMGHLELSKKIQDHLHMTKIERVMIGANWANLEKFMKLTLSIFELLDQWA